LDVKRFREDLYEVARRACSEEEGKALTRMMAIADILVGMYKKKLVKINHSALELVCAGSLVREGCEVRVENRLGRTLVCDVFGKSARGQLIVEIETGFIPPEAALVPSVYARSRIASKIARYSRFADRFALGTTPAYVLDFPRFFVKDTDERTTEDAEEVKALTDVYYDKPSISVEELMKSHLDSVVVIDVDKATTHELDPKTYQQRAAAFIAGNHTARERQAGVRTLKS